jgi:hypothetical protein
MEKQAILLILFVVTVLLTTAPVMANVIVTVTDAGDGSGWLTIAYDVNGEPNFVRAFALDIVASDANIVEIDSLSTDYWVYPGTIDINDAGEVNDAGSPVAPNDVPGALGGLGTSGITIEMGALFEEGVDPAPGGTGTLLRVRVDGDSEVCVTGNAMRGKVVMKDGSSHEPVSACSLVCTPCLPPPCCPGDSDDDGDWDLDDYYALQGNLAYADYLLSGGAGTDYKVIDGNATTGHLYQVCQDLDSDSDLDLIDYYSLQGNLAYWCYLCCGGVDCGDYRMPTPCP